MDAPFGLALGAGLVAAVNPCGFALLPAYLSMLVLGDEPAADRGRLAPVRRALVLTAAMTLGFVAVFGTFGLLAAPLADTIAQRLPWVTVVIGLVLVGLGGWLVAGRHLPTFTPPSAAGPALSRRFLSMAIFGAAYAIASLGCTIGPFLAVVVSSFQAGSVLAGIGLFVAYAVGMGLVVGAAALAVALARESLLRRVRRASGPLSRVAGVLLVITGAYVAWYGWYEIRVLSGGDGDDPIIEAAATVQTAISSWLSDIGPGAVAIVGAVLLAVAVAVLVRRRRA